MIDYSAVDALNAKKRQRIRRAHQGIGNVLKSPSCRAILADEQLADWAQILYDELGRARQHLGDFA
ncbi:MAG: hypothetical protein AAF567_24415 [Actinomycetota bacterium]